ncbi:MAG: ribosomal RNA small subunit methyltransferase A [Candidatus Marinimicrobia bacterium]|nr:ribosomal RNA small subunit methyltransferase A [Candidatus Neomarinimicrobiota bacterium]|tara:strand:- start:21879 stop:22619 length:741 start_codon:yes stop_codon:yes gene_type:complete
MIHPKKKWGQNFLVDPNISKKIVNLLDINLNDTILEIGPGKGALTKYIKAKKITAIEIDNNLCELIEKQKIKNLDIINQDFLKTNLNNLKFNKIVGNLPYNISSQIIFKLLGKCDWSKAVIMLQKELADRIASNKGTKKYGRISVMIQSMCHVTKEFNISANCFYPKPEVTSSIISLVNKKTPIDYKNLELIVRACFSQRRKKIKNTLKEVCKHENLSNYYDKRPESLSVDDFLLISKTIKQNSLL